MSDSNELISVIMPCFNVEHTIKWTVDSVLNQTYSNIELICVDDASTDNTREVLEQLSMTDSRIRIISNSENLGPGTSRNKAIDIAKGEYISFIDGDDFYEVDFLELLYQDITLTGSDISQCQIRYIYNNNNYLVGSPVGTISGIHCSYRIDINDGLPYLNPQLWNKLYKSSLFSGLSIKAITYEDACIMIELANRCNKFSVINDTHYNYNKRYSVLTGNVKRNVNSLDWYFNSIVTSVTPYYNLEFLELIKTWGVSEPRCSKANLSNFLKSLLQTKDLYTSEECSIILKEIDTFEKNLLLVIPEQEQLSFVKIINWFRNEFSSPSYLLKMRKASSHIRFIGNKVKLGIVERSISLIDNVVKKDNKKWVFSTWSRNPTHTMDNPRAIFEAVKYDSDIKKIVILNSNKEIAKDVDNNIIYLPLHSVRALYAMLTSGYIYTGYSLHNIFGYRKLKLNNKRKIIQLWHGIPIKKIGLAVPQRLENYWKKEAKRYSMLVANSDVDQVMMAKSFSPEELDKVKVTGLPRHDIILMEEKELPTSYADTLTSIKKRLDGRKLVLFAPTWRYGNEKPCFFEVEELKRLEALLIENNSVLGIRVHGNMLKGNTASYLSNNIIYLNDIPDVNVLLREVDCLITDYSSIYLDFMCLNRAVILYTPDIDKYKSNRGFNYTAEEFIPHNEFIDTFEKLESKLENILSDNYELDSSYWNVKERFYKFASDNNNSSRVLEYLK
ncbi:TPA: bifunctional glycosyltransferase/CDP-glycerol:glycerophosphate glycerophosphotransferase [Photobacterium damselae]